MTILIPLTLWVSLGSTSQGPSVDELVKNVLEKNPTIVSSLMTTEQAQTWEDSVVPLLDRAIAIWNGMHFKITGRQGSEQRKFLSTLQEDLDKARPTVIKDLQEKRKSLSRFPLHPYDLYLSMEANETDDGLLYLGLCESLNGQEKLLGTTYADLSAIGVQITKLHLAARLHHLAVIMLYETALPPDRLQEIMKAYWKSHPQKPSDPGQSRAAFSAQRKVAHQ